MHWKESLKVAFRETGLCWAMQGKGVQLAVPPEAAAALQKDPTRYARLTVAGQGLPSQPDGPG